MLPLRFPKLWSVIGWLLVLAVIVGSLVPDRAFEVVHTNDKVQHFAAYFLLMVWFAGFYRRAVYPLIAAVLMALGLGLDALQGLTETRSFDLLDVATNCGGVIVGLVSSSLLLGGWCQRIEQRLLS